MQFRIAVSALALSALFVVPRTARAQAPCSVNRTLVDSAREEVRSVLTSDSKLVAELKQEQKLSDPASMEMPMVRDPAVCAKLAGTFSHLVPPGLTFAVIRVGNLYYARDPQQSRATGVITDASFNVLMRFGAAVPTREK